MRDSDNNAVVYVFTLGMAAAIIPTFCVLKARSIWLGVRLAAIWRESDAHIDGMTRGHAIRAGNRGRRNWRMSKRSRS